MDRRAFIGSLTLGTVIGPRAASTQPARKIARIGLMTFGGKTAEISGPEPSRPSVKALFHGLRQLGYVYGQDFVTEARGGEGRPELWPGQAAELVRLKVDLIVGAGPNLATLRKATSTIPVVMAAAGDPVGDGYAQSLGRPGGNFTGLSLQEFDTIEKRLELLKELVPFPAPVAVLWNVSAPYSLRYWQAAEAAAQKRGWKLVRLGPWSADELAGAFKAATDARASSLLPLATGNFFVRAQQIAAMAARSQLPTMYDLREYVEVGGLISYGPNILEIWRRAAVFVDKILKGARPAELPVEQPSKFELVIHLKAAKALGLPIPPQLRLRADQVME
jgi:putative ABC transport system substrate-binding protein